MIPCANHTDFDTQDACVEKFNKSEQNLEVTNIFV